MAAAASDDTPFHLKGNFAPITEELTAFDLPVEGAIPPDLRGLYVRNGANPKGGTSKHWFLGNGMIHGVRLEDGKVSWYRNRYVKTPFLENPDMQRISDTGTIDRTCSAANTHVLGHAGKILALEEGSFPFVLDAELNTTGWTDYGGRLTTAMTAHPKICPVTGEFLGFGYGQLPPYLVYHRVSPQGELVQSEEITVGGPTMMHDFQITENHAIFMDLPVIFDLELALQGTMPFRWSDDYAARVGIMPRTGNDADVTWFDVDPCYVFHGVNAWEEDGKVFYDVCRTSELWRDSSAMGATSDAVNTLHRWTFDLATRTTKEETLDDRVMDFPRVADARVGLKHRYAFTLQFGSGLEGAGFAGLLKFDMQTGRSELHSFGEGVSPGEPCFVHSPGADPDSDDGYVMAFVTDESSLQTDFVILDASNWSGDPVARVRMPQRVPVGFHGSWVADAK